jgi:hypothetical protein
MSGMAAHRGPRHRRRPLAAITVGAVAVGAVACAEPALPETTQGEGAERPVEASAPDPAREALVAELTELRATVAAARDELAAALDPSETATARRAGDRAVAWLLDGPDRAEAAPLFPSTTTDRGDLGNEDRLSTVLTAARDAGGALGRATLELLRDPVAGDLGTWQRDPAGVVASVQATTAAGSDLTAREQAVLELPGEGTRALAWAMLTAEARDREAAAAYAERGIAHLDIILGAVDELLADAEAGSAADPDGGEPDGDDPGDDPTEEDV